MIAVINIHICLASLYALYEEYNQNGCTIKFNNKPNSGYFKEVAICPPIVNNGSKNCVIILNILFFFIQ